MVWFVGRSLLPIKPGRDHRLRIAKNTLRHRVVGAFPDGESALMLVAARLRHIATTKWGTRRYLKMELLNQPQEIDEAIA
jgi:hypothetical protein